MESRAPAQKRLANLRGLALTVAVGSIALGWGILEYGPWLLYPLAGMLLGATVVTANAEELLDGNGWKGASMLLGATILWLPLFFVLFGIFIQERHAEAQRE